MKSASQLKPVMIRRLKGELRRHLANSQIPERETLQVDLSGLADDAPELLLADKLAAYVDLLEQRVSGGTNKQKSAAKLVGIALQKRLLSSIEAFARTLAVHRRSAAARAASQAAAGGQAKLLVEEREEDLTEEQTRELEEVEVARATKAGGVLLEGGGEKLLSEMTEVAERHRDRPDAKMRALIDWIRQNQCPDLPGPGAKSKGVARWLPRRVLIFTEYADTKNYLVHQLKAAIEGTDKDDERILTLHGGMDEEDREQVKQAFNDPNHPVRILIATDAAREGVNLQGCCADLFHFDLPWNPGRMEQRNGRIDRTLQPEPKVRCHYFVYTQRPEDEVLKALVQKTARIHKELGSLADVIERKIAQVLDGGIRRSKQKEQLAQIEASTSKGERDATADEELEQSRELDSALKDQLADLETLYQKARDHIDLKAERLRDVASLGLQMAGLPPLTPSSTLPGSFEVPGLDKIAASDPSWRDITDTLRAPRTRKMPEWEWRAQNPPRPVSFEPATTLASRTVQLHLQHKLTQRALAAFRAQAFGEEKLARVTIVLDPTSARKRVLALGKLALYGPGASRLHEEIIAVAAYWAEGADPARLKPFETREAEEKAIESLSAVLTRPDQQALPEHIIKTVMASAKGDEEALWHSLGKKSLGRAVWATEKLRQRGSKEASEMQVILDRQKAAIGKELSRRGKLADEAAQREAKRAAKPLLPGMEHLAEDEAEQYVSDTRHIERRLREIDQEMESEPKRIQAMYEVKYERLERVGLVYLWPVTS